ncbi:type VI secretion-associated protein [Klebsiella quasipneumoniae]|nr:type VI secretion-associated protein [Klebsiella quasipneumoniae]
MSILQNLVAASQLDESVLRQQALTAGVGNSDMDEMEK